MNEEIKWPEITKDTPLPELKHIHQQIWDYAIENGEKPETPYFVNCVACEYKGPPRGDCSKCPIIWPENDDEVCKCTGVWCRGLYSQWYDAKGEEKTALARQIRNLPWRFEVEE